VIENVSVVDRGPIWLDDVDCRGNESDLAECLHGPWGFTDCDHEDEVSVSCYNTSITAMATTTSPGTPAETRSVTIPEGTVAVTTATAITTLATITSSSSGNLLRLPRL